MIPPLIAGFAVVHTLAVAAWFGCMVYSVTLVQRHPAVSEQPAVYEDFVTTLSHGVRWQVLGMLAAIVPTWAAIVLLRVAAPDPPGAWWIALVVTKSATLLFATALFWYLSWRLWPRRIFALPEELPGIRAQFRVTSILLTFALGAALALGIAADNV